MRWLSARFAPTTPPWRCLSVSCGNARGSRGHGTVHGPEGAGPGHCRAQLRREPSRRRRCISTRSAMPNCVRAHMRPRASTSNRRSTSTKHDMALARSTSRPLSMLAQADASLGDYAARGANCLGQSTIRERVGGPNHPFVAIALDGPRDRHTANRACQLRRSHCLNVLWPSGRKSLGPNHRDVARTLVEMASTLHADRPDDGGRRRPRHALSASGNASTHPTLRTMPRPSRSTPSCRHVAATMLPREATTKERWRFAARVFGTSNPAYADTQAGLALALAKLGDRESRSQQGGQRRSNRTRSLCGLMLRSLPERQALDYAAARPRALDLILSLTGSTPEAIDAGYRWPDSEPGAGSRRNGGTPAVAADRNRECRSASSGASQSAQQRLANLVVRGPGQLSPAQYAAVRRRRAPRERAGGTGAGGTERSSSGRSEAGRKSVSSEVRASLPPDSALVSFVRYDRTLFSEPPKYPAAKQRCAFRPRAPSRRISRSCCAPTSRWLSCRWVPARTIDSSCVAVESRHCRRGAASAAVRRVGPVISRVGTRTEKARLGSVGASPRGCEPRIHRAGRRVEPGAVRRAACRTALVSARTRAGHPLSLGRARSRSDSERTLAAVGQGLLALGGPAFDDPSLFSAGQNRRESRGQVPSVTPASLRVTPGSGLQRASRR